MTNRGKKVSTEQPPPSPFFQTTTRQRHTTVNPPRQHVATIITTRPASSASQNRTMVATNTHLAVLNRNCPPQCGHSSPPSTASHHPKPPQPHHQTHCVFPLVVLNLEPQSQATTNEPSRPQPHQYLASTAGSPLASHSCPVVAAFGIVEVDRATPWPAKSFFPPFYLNPTRPTFFRDPFVFELV